MKFPDSQAVDKYYSTNQALLRLIAGRYLHMGVYRTDTDDVDVAKQRTVDALAQWATITSHSKVLDVGSGNGESVIHLAKTYGCEIIGVEPIAQQVTFAQSQVPPPLEQKVAFQLGRAETLSFESAAFDAVLSIDVLCHVEAIENGLSQLARVLKPGGALAFSDLVLRAPQSVHSRAYFEKAVITRSPDTIEKYKARLAKAGFSQIESVDQSENYARHFRVGVHRMKMLKKQIIDQFGEEKFDEFLAYYKGGLDPLFLKEVGWAWFKAVRV